MDGIDLDYLARQTAGDSELQQELLMLFLTQLQGLETCLGPAATADTLPVDAGLAAHLHRVRGAAVAIGARDLAATLGQNEAAIAAGGLPAACLSVLISQIAAVRREVAGLIAAREFSGLAKAGESR